MDSSLIFVVIVALWGLVLLPGVVRHRATLGGSRVRDRFSVAMRVLDRRRGEPHPAGRTYVHPRRPSEPAPPSAAAGPARPVSAPSRDPRRPGPPTRRALAVVVLAALAALVLAVPVTVVASATGVLPFWLPAVPLASLVAVVVGLRLRALARRRARTPSAARLANRTSPPAGTGPVPAASRSPQAPPAPQPAQDPPAPQPAPRPEQRPGTWTPVPVPPPTYTLKPAAVRRAVTVDVPEQTRPAVEPAPQPTPQPRHQPVAATWDLDAVLERRRAAAG